MRVRLCVCVCARLTVTRAARALTGAYATPKERRPLLANSTILLLTWSLSSSLLWAMRSTTCETHTTPHTCTLGAHDHSPALIKNPTCVRVCVNLCLRTCAWIHVSFPRTCGEPLTTLNFSPVFRSSSVAHVYLSTGLKGKNLISLYCSLRDFCARHEQQPTQTRACTHHGLHPSVLSA
jgi:hypothetical protein